MSFFAKLAVTSPTDPVSLLHHRSRFGPAVRAALSLLDRVADGQPVAPWDVELALQVTGDAQPVARAMREGPSWQRERHPWA
jgi:hypothetical protein